jgi:hypothetical protein
MDYRQIPRVGMSTTMTELNWQAAVAVFRASLPRRGAKGRKVSAATITARLAASRSAS